MAQLTLSTSEVVLFDAEDAELILATGPWYRHKSPSGYRPGNKVYACAGSGSSKTKPLVLMHRLLAGLTPGQRDENGKRLTVDHINGDGLDNRRFNLDVVTWGENVRRARERRAAGRAEAI